MSQAYGTVLFSKSTGCQLNSQLVVDVLNKYKWSNTDIHLIWEDHTLSYNAIALSECNFTDPTAFPLDLTYEIDCDNGKTRIVRPEEMTKADSDLICSEMLDSVDLATFAKELSKHIASGWIEISCIGYEGYRVIYFEVLHIEADGTGHYRTHIQRSYQEPANGFQNF